MIAIHERIMNIRPLVESSCSSILSLLFGFTDTDTDFLNLVVSAAERTSAFPGIPDGCIDEKYDKDQAQAKSPDEMGLEHGESAKFDFLVGGNVRKQENVQSVVDCPGDEKRKKRKWADVADDDAERL